MRAFGENRIADKNVESLVLLKLGRGLHQKVAGQINAIKGGGHPTTAGFSDLDIDLPEPNTPPG
jgi:hypothetical protein